MNSKLDKFEETLDELRVIRDLDEYKSNSPDDLKELLESLIQRYEEIIKDAPDIEDSDIKKANELIEKLINAQPALEDLKENLNKRTKIIFSLKKLEKEKDNFNNIIDLTTYKEKNKNEFDKTIEDIIKSFYEVTSIAEKDSKEYNKAVDYIKEIVNKHPELKQLEKVLLEDALTISKKPEEQIKEITTRFDKEKLDVKVTSITEEIEKLKKNKITNQNELNKYRELIEQYKKEILENQHLTQQEKQELINKLDKDNQIISMLEILQQKDVSTGGPSL